MQLWRVIGEFEIIPDNIPIYIPDEEKESELVPVGGDKWKRLGRRNP